jgi:hypothetical protein
MPRDKDFKRHVRRRMDETGERYMQAREQLRGGDGPIAWHLAGGRPDAYEAAVETGGPAPGARVDVLRCVGDPGRDFGTLLHRVPAAGMEGRRVRFSASVRGEDVASWAGLWMRVDGRERRALAFDNMGHRPLQGTFDWRQVAVVLDVPAAADSISFGLLLTGRGTVRLAGPRLEPVGPEVAPTGAGAVDGWMLAGDRREAYRLVSEPSETPDARGAVSVLRSVSDPGRGFGTMMTTVAAEPHRGRRLRLSAVVRGDDVVSWAGLWMRVDGRERQALAFDNMQDRPLRGTFGWTSVSVVLDVAEEASTIAYGVLLHGAGTVRVTGAELAGT